MNLEKTAGHVTKFASSISDFSLGKSHLKFFTSLPEHVFSRTRVMKNMYNKRWTHKEHHQSYELNNVFRFILIAHNNYLYKISESILEEKAFKDLDLFLDNESVHIKNIYSYFHEIFTEIAIYENLRYDAIYNSMNNIATQSMSFGEISLQRMLKLRFFDNLSHLEKTRKILYNYIFKGSSKQPNRHIMDGNGCVAKFILKNQAFFDIPDFIFKSALPDYINTFISFIGTKMSNLIMDISLYPNVRKELEAEQRSLIKKYGRSITSKQIDEMVYLDAAITESLRLGTNNPMKEAICDSYLPNGAFVQKSSLVKFTTISYNRSSEIYGRDPHCYIPERHFELGTKLEESSLTNIAWGLGRPCPYRQYCARYMKYFAALFIRLYNITQGSDNGYTGHQGYIFDIHVLHAKKNLFLSRRDL
ncbi:hypothetical protein BB560_002195 [Smittium megazygosporum]|uniref:Cytochrome P450 n=1 Tax=Smittium megazygosporum TaxID=133381 RepID=A0A2T9ZFI6_9FUNG|nr:hypothetical protein BB560_002195 [Smittium megazygosporum]